MYYKKHMFICTNKRNDNTGCGYISFEDPVIFAKKYLKSHPLYKDDLFRISASGCLGRCTLGPTCVIYPQGNWYSYIDETDLKEIIESDLLNDKQVNRLLI